MNNQDIIKFQSMRSSLLRERESIQDRLTQIDSALSGEPVSLPLPKPGLRRSERVSNKLSLKEAVLQSLSATPISRGDLLASVENLGYRFKTAKPLNSLQTFLYGAGKALVNKVDGKFALKGATSAPSAETQLDSPIRKKRRMSAAGRKAIAAAQKARWAKKKAEKKLTDAAIPPSAHTSK